MKVNWKKLTALLLAVIMMLSLTGLGEDEITIENNVSENALDDTDQLAILDSLADELIAIDESIDLSLPDDTLGSIEETIPILEEINDAEPIDLDQDDTNAANTVTLGVSETYKLNTKSLGTGLTYKSSKPNIVSVTTSGTVKGLKKGTAVVSVLSGTKVKKKYTIKVVAAPSKVTLPAKTVTLGVKESVTMTPTIPKNTHTTLTWTNKDATVASVTKAGKITGKKAGSTTITVKTHNGKKATVKVIVKAAPKKVKLNKTSLTMKLYEEFQLKATLPSGSISNKLTWTSSNPDVVTVFEDGWLFAGEVGTATITVKTYNGKKATCKVTVADDDEEEGGEGEGEEETPTPEPTAEPIAEPTAEPTVEPTPEPTAEPIAEPTAEPTVEPTPVPTPTRIELDDNDALMLAGTGFYLHATVYPSNAVTQLTWSSNNASKISVDQNGFVHADGYGKAVITVTTDNGLSATCTVESTDMEVGIFIDEPISKVIDKMPISLIHNQNIYHSSGFDVGFIVNDSNIVTAVNIQPSIPVGRFEIFGIWAEMKYSDCGYVLDDLGFSYIGKTSGGMYVYELGSYRIGIALDDNYRVKQCMLTKRS